MFSTDPFGDLVRDRAREFAAAAARDRRTRGLATPTLRAALSRAVGRALIRAGTLLI